MKTYLLILSTLLVVATLPIAIVACGQQSDAQLRDFVNAQVKMRPESEIQDIYKLLYQGVFGVGHLITSEQEAFQTLSEEMRALGEPVPGEPLVESCLPDGSMLRVNLRPFRTKGLDPRLLVAAMMETVKKVKAERVRFEALWSDVGDLIEAREIDLDVDEYQAFTRDVQEQQFPVVSHSTAYKKAYRPAYRVVLKTAFDLYFPTIP